MPGQRVAYQPCSADLESAILGVRHRRLSFLARQPRPRILVRGRLLEMLRQRPHGGVVLAPRHSVGDAIYG
jgi:hypothetical protein